MASNSVSKGRRLGVIAESPRTIGEKALVERNSPHDSPISSIVRDLGRSTLSSGYKSKLTGRSMSSPGSADRNLTDFGENNLCDGHVDLKDGLFKNAFKIRNTPENSVKSRPRARRLLGMASRRLSSPDATSPLVDKENGSSRSTPITNISSPQKISGPKLGKVSRCPLEDCDPNSQDSGYGASYSEREDHHDGFRFAEPLGVAPRRMSVESRSPVQSPVRSSPTTPRRTSSFRSLTSDYESMDDGFNELIDMESLAVEGVEQSLPNGISSLLSGHIVAATEKPMECDGATTPEFAKTRANVLRRSLSLQNERRKDDVEDRCTTPPVSKVRSCLFRSPNATSSTSKLSYNESPRIGDFYSPSRDSPPPRSFKRPEPPSDASPLLVKRSKKSSSLQQIPESFAATCKPSLQRSFSETEAHAHIKSAVHRSTTDTDLTGDFSKTCILPLAEGHHEDLKSITPETLVELIKGRFDESIHSYTIVDCRYPYEYEGGHIDGALNLYNKDLIEQHLLNPITDTPEIQPACDKRRILIFHCEFSWERGPNLSRFLRNIDRQRNKEHYPALHYPEVYLLHGGYEEFYRRQREYCSPKGYRPMKHPDHEADLRQFRNKSKSWQGEKPRPNGLTARANLKRLGL